jgi:acid stress-induced BolA-like protein IbaG/YrbA
MSQILNSVSEIQSVLKRRLQLIDPRFELESVGTKVSGLIIDPSFYGMPDSERQRRIWEALDHEYHAESVRRVGTLLAYTVDEWDIN